MCDCQQSINVLIPSLSPFSSLSSPSFLSLLPLRRVAQYFFKWLELRGEVDWLEKHVHAFLAMGAPFLGSSKAIRTVLCGDAMGLEVGG